MLRLITALSLAVMMQIFGPTAVSLAQVQQGAEAKLKSLGITLPNPRGPVGNYVSVVRVGNLLFMAGTSGRRPDGSVVKGKLGADMTTDEGYQAARLVALTVLSYVRAELGSLDRVKRLVRTTGFVNAGPDYTEHAKALNGFSDVMVEVLGERGRGARSALGMGSLPFQVAVICETIFEVE
jgi:enamine deaminase RidA (YjgF/YER057c/UK114 family)